MNPARAVEMSGTVDTSSITSSPTRAPPRWNPNAEVSNSLVPDRVTALSAPPVKPDWRMSKGATSTWNCSTASMGMTRAPARPPAMLLVDSPKTSWLSAPSMLSVLKR